jgi:hypothetical protein
VDDDGRQIAQAAELMPQVFRQRLAVDREHRLGSALRVKLAQPRSPTATDQHDP